MRCFNSSAEKYGIQFDYNTRKDNMADVLLPSCQLRMMNLTGLETGATVSQETGDIVQRDGFFHMNACNEALNALDRCGWKRSYHQREFHSHYLRACARVFFKLEPSGSFERAHKRILELNGWDVLNQEVLISTPRRFGKTISISMFVAALVFACPAVECSIYSTCKRISQKLLRNVCKFLELIHYELKLPQFKVIRKNQEEVNLNGPEGIGDVRTVSSYPSRVNPTTHTQKHTHTTPHYTTLHYTTPHYTTLYYTTHHRIALIC